jgi:serine/threonine protein kinase/tetratricopeptide (TPR) repeat protein
LGQPTERVGQTIGPYKLLEQIGEGGMGVVFMAEQQEPVRRKVALKLIKPGMDTRQVIARFEAERQALAVMDHPGIARVLDAGTTPSGHPYFVMELVRGVPITSYCDENNLPVRERLELFASLCQAIQHAHTKGIIHRDIKPTNILVTRQDGRAVVKVIDFGVAKAMGQQLTEKTLFTNFAQMIGTPLYMSPEQAEQSGVDIDTRSDIYSLGVLLYELLTGSTPVDAEQLKRAAFEEIRRIIREVDPPTPSARISGSNTLAAIAAHRHIEPARLSKLVRGELDWIVMKALEKDRNRRYETANAFATDLLHHLNDEPVQACPPSAAYRFRKFSRRNRVALATVGLVAASLVLGTVASTWQAIRATRAEGLAEQRLVAETKARTEADTARAAEAEQRRLAEAEQTRAEEQRAVAESERAKADAQRAVAEANYQKAREAVDKYFTLVSESKLLDVPGLQPLRKELLEAALLFYQGSAVERTDDPAVLADLAVTYMRVAMISHNVDRNDDTVAAIDQALKVIDRLRSEFPDQRESLRRLGGFWSGLRRMQPATKLPKDPMAAFQSLTRLINTWEDLVAQFPGEVPLRSDLAALYGLTGDLLASGGQMANAFPYLSKAKLLLLQLTQEVPDHPGYRADLARTHELLAWSLRTGRPQEAEAEERAGLTLREQLVAEFPESRQYRENLYESLVQFLPYARQRDPAEAVRLARQIKETGESLVRDYPNVDVYLAERGDWISTWLPVVVANGDQEEIKESLSQLDEMIAQFSKDGDSESLNSLAWKMAVSADVDERIAEAAARAALRACDLLPRDASCLNTLGVAQYRKGDYAAAIESLGRSRIFDAGLTGGMAAIDCYFLAMAHAKLGHAEQAEKWFRVADLWMALFAATNEELKRFRAEAIDVVGVEAEPISRMSLTPETEQELLRLCVAADPQGGWVHHWMGTRLAERGAWSEADEQLTQAAASLSENPMAHYRHALVRLELGDQAGYRAACARMCEHLGAASDTYARYWLAWTCSIGPEAVTDWSVPLGYAQDLLEKEPKNIGYLTSLGSVLFRAGRFEEAAARLAKANAAYQSGNGDGGSPLYPQIFLAMAHHKLGHAEEARRWLAEARSRIEKEPLEKMPWNRRATVELLLAEAEQMIVPGH